MRKSQPYNCFGEAIPVPFQFASPDFDSGTLDRFGNPVADYSRCKTEFSDDNGFDIRNVEENGHYKVRYILPKGSVIIRYGHEYGRYTAPEHTPFEELSLPYTIESLEYHEYKVLSEGLPVQCIVEKGRVAPMFHQPGGGVQYLHSNSIHSLVWNEQLERIK